MTETKLLAAVAGVDGVYCMDAIDFLWTLPRGSVDMIAADLPYGTTACNWDEVIPFEPMWAAFKRVLKPERVIVLTASQPFTTKLIASNIEMFRYEWIWIKTNGGGFLNANRQPLKRHENVLIFYERTPLYEPQMVKGKPYRTRSASAGETTQDQTVAGWVTDNDGYRFPTSILEYVSETGLHPTQKPVDLFRYLVRTYTLPGEIVVDPTCGSGTTAVAAREEGRHYIVNDSSREYVDVTKRRLAMPFTPSFMPALESA
jgi:site-specific DNA-methyltransferase (adenine-specific)